MRDFSSGVGLVAWLLFAGLALASVVQAQEVRTLSLVFATPEGGTLDTVRILAGSSTEVVAVLENTELLQPDEEVSVSLAAMTVTTNVSELTLTADVSSAIVVIGAAHDVASLSGSMEASGEVVSGTGVPGMAVIPISLPVAVKQRRFWLSLLPRFSHEVNPGITVPGGEWTRSTIPCCVGHHGRGVIGASIDHALVCARYSCLLGLARCGGSVKLDSPNSTDAALRRAYTSEDHAGLASLVGTQAQGEWELSVRCRCVRTSRSCLTQCHAVYGR